MSKILYEVYQNDITHKRGLTPIVRLRNKRAQPLFFIIRWCHFLRGFCALFRGKFVSLHSKLTKPTDETYIIPYFIMRRIGLDDGLYGQWDIGVRLRGR